MASLTMADRASGRRRVAQTSRNMSHSSRCLLGLDLKGRLYCVRQSCSRQVSGRCRGENATAVILTLLMGRLLGHRGSCGLLEELLGGGLLGERGRLLLPGQLLWWGVLCDEHLLRLRLHKGCRVLLLDQELPLLIDKACRSQLLNQLLLVVVGLLWLWLDQDWRRLLVLDQDVLGGDSSCLLGSCLLLERLGRHGTTSHLLLWRLLHHLICSCG